MPTPAPETALDALRTYTSFAVIGVSAQPEKYGHEVFETLLTAGYTVYPINPKYSEIDGHPCYPSLAALPVMPDVVVLTLSPQTSEQALPKVVAAGARLIWLPPGCFTQAAVQVCKDTGIAELHDVCPVGAMDALRTLTEQESNGTT